MFGGVCARVLCNGARAAAMGAARHALAHAPAAAAPGGPGPGLVSRRPRAGAACAALGQPESHHGHLAQNTDGPQESLPSADARWHRQRHHRRYQRLQ